MQNRKGWNILILGAVTAFSVFFHATAANATEIDADRLFNPVYYENGCIRENVIDEHGNVLGNIYEYKNDKRDYGKWSMITFGSYPQSEVPPSEAKLISQINWNLLNDKVFDGGGDTFVDGIKYRKVAKSEITDQEHLGTWTQDTDYRYFKWEPIRWRVLSYDPEVKKLLVMSDKILDCKEFHDVKESVNWETCTLRSWLNTKPTSSGRRPGKAGDNFSTAFSFEEWNAIMETRLNLNGLNDDFHTDDRIFVPSTNILTNQAYGFNPNRDYPTTTRTLLPTDYAAAMGVSYYSGHEKKGTPTGEYWWYNRLGSDYSCDFSPINTVGAFYPGVILSYDKKVGVVPALCLDPESDQWHLEESGFMKHYIRLDGNPIKLLEDVVTTDQEGKTTFPGLFRAGYYFDGWYTAATGGQKVDENTVFDKDMTVYAHWDRIGDPQKDPWKEIVPGVTTVKTADGENVKGDNGVLISDLNNSVAKASIKSAKNNKKKTVTLKLKNIKADGYEIVYSYNKKFRKGVKRIFTSKKKILLKKLKKNKTCYIKVRAFNKTASGKQVFGAFSKVKKVKIKK